MRPWAKLKRPEPDQLVAGVFSKREAAELIASGTHHVHSTALGTRDPGHAITLDIMNRGKLVTYPWERLDGAAIYTLASSKTRHDLIQQIAQEQGNHWKRDMRESVIGVLEELATNGLYHSYHNPDGSPRFPRRGSVELSAKEQISIHVKSAEEGFFLSIRDQGGNFTFDRVASSFRRCYGAAQQQIENKEGGAGLGLYMVFETVTHLKVICAPGKYTEISCWIANHHNVDPAHFSFNFFEWR